MALNILQLCSKVPHPPKDGGAVAMDILTQGLTALGAVLKVLAISTGKHPFESDKISPEYRELTGIETVFIDTRVKLLPALFNLFSKSSYNMSRFYSPQLKEKLIEVLQSRPFDIVQLETLFVAPYVSTIRKYSRAKIVLRSQNIEYSIWEREASQERNPIRKWYLSLLARRLKAYELGMLNAYDGIASITPGDGAFFEASGCSKPVICIPFGLDIKAFTNRPGIVQEFPSCFHLGAMNWGPNNTGVKWLLDNVWEKVSREQPSLKLYLAGRYMPKWLKQLNRKNIVICGEVENQFDFMQSKGIMLVPLLSGGGMRIKIIEGMAIGKTIISTSIGAEGIPFGHGKNILIADTADEFAACIRLLVNDPELYARIGENARQLVEEHFDNAQICQNLLRFYGQLISSRSDF